MKVSVYGDSLLKFVLWENGRYIMNREPVDRFSEEFHMEIVNRSYFGACVDRGLLRIRKDIRNETVGDYAVVEYGGNDCSYDWRAVSEKPDEEHDSLIPLQEYLGMIRQIIRELKAAGARPILTNLVPFDPQLYLDWVTRSLNHDAILQWLGEDNRVYRQNELYSRSLERLAAEESVPVVDLRSAFLIQPKLKAFYCGDGIHPNRAGQALIYDSFSRFVESNR